MIWTEADLCVFGLGKWHSLRVRRTRGKGKGHQFHVFLSRKKEFIQVSFLSKITLEKPAICNSLPSIWACHFSFLSHFRSFLSSVFLWRFSFLLLRWSVYVCFSVIISSQSKVSLQHRKKKSKNQKGTVVTSIYKTLTSKRRASFSDKFPREHMRRIWPRSVGS